LNETKKSYLNFLSEKEKVINILKNSYKIKLRGEKISKVLPSYQQGILVDGSMTDLEFVNYIENLLKSFKLNSHSSVGISELVLVEDKNKNNRDTISSQIFYIPLKLELEGTKSNIVDFLYFLQKVGRIESVQDDNITFYSDNVLNNNLLGNQTNIYENKIVDIESIEFYDYIDTSSNPATQKDALSLMSYIKNGVEKDETYKINISLRFYVKGLPTYKIESYIAETISLYNKKLKLITSNLKNLESKKSSNTSNEVLTIISSLNSINTYLNDLEPTIKILQNGLKGKNNYDDLYSKALKVKYDIDNISTVLDSNIKKIKN
ncbi:MAG: hypothetical protein PHE25_00005, partial [Candidatus Gracilibacteria bacterium]|nr:hypothetical protein [Candidatus Gracilibacteria bacterium]